MLKTSPTPRDRGEALASAERTLESELAGLRALADALRNGLAEPFSRAIAVIQEAVDSGGRVIVTGMGKSGHIGRKISATLASTGTPSYFVHAAEASHGDLGMIGHGDCVIALSWSGETAELKAIVDYTRRFRVTLLSLTANADSSLARAADLSLVLPRVTEACPHGLAPTTSALMQLAIGDALAVALLESKGFTAGDFGILHPGGQLGAALRYVRDLMHAGDSMPLVTLGTGMADAIMVMSNKRLGAVIVVDSEGGLAGIITDGDLRRHLGPDLMTRSVEDVMTRHPRTVRPDALVGAALEIMNAANITGLIVAEEGRPVGFLHMHDLLRSGVA